MAADGDGNGMPDLLAAALDDAGLDFGDPTPIQQPVVDVKPAVQPLYIQANSVATPRGGNVRATTLPRVAAPTRIIRLPAGTVLRTSNGTPVRFTATATGQSILATGNGQQFVIQTAKPMLVNNTGRASPSLLKKVKLEPKGTTMTPTTAPPPEPLPDELVIDDEDDDYKAETYSIYRPSKLKIGYPHPDPVVEATSLASVQPPDVSYRLAIPEEVIDRGLLSALQLESIVYASQQHETFLQDGSRAGFLLGDGAGVGKGRTLAGIIYENWELDRKRAIWLSVSNDLKFDAERDLRDIGASKIPVHLLNKFKYGKISKSENGGFKKGIIFSTYSSLIGETASAPKEKYRTRLGQLVKWFGKDFDGVIVFDECHKAKNLCPSGSGKPTKTGKTVLELQRKLPLARIVYASATGASEPKNMAYMVRLGLWGKGTSFPEFTDFAMAVEKRGVGAMEMVAIEMKLRGVYIARQLSFHGVEFKTEKIELSNKFKRLYNECVDLWVDAKFRFERALALMEDDNTIKKQVWGQFWGAHQRFFKYLCIAAKVKHAVNIAREALKSDKCVVIGLQSTGESKTMEQLEENGELTDFVSTAKAVFQTLIDKHFPAPNRRKTMQLLGPKKSLFEELGIQLTTNGNVKFLPESHGDNSASTSNSASRSQSKWNISDSEGENSDAAGELFDISASSSSDDDFESVSEKSDSDLDEMDKLWDQFQSKQEKKAKKRRLVSKKKKKAKRPVKRRKVVERKQDYGYLNADFLSDEACAICEKLRDELIDRLDSISNLPPNTLDELIDELGGPEQVAEMTGRKGRLVSKEDGTVEYESRTENDVSMDILNVCEKERFMAGEKYVAIISEAASSGISLHSDKRAVNRKRRVHITIELPWSADRAIQQFGRSHRSNQLKPPEYIFLISDLAGEKRFASIVASRLQSLGALSHGDRNAKRDLSEYHIDNRHGQAALENIMRTIVSKGQDLPLVKPPKINNSEKEFYSACCIALHGVGFASFNESRNEYSLEKDYNSVSKFLNRLLGMPFELQNALFKFFNDTLAELIKKAKERGYSEGIKDVSSDVSKVEIINENSYFHKHSTGSCRVCLYHVGVDKGVSWETVEARAKNFTNPDEGFYYNPNVKGTSVQSVFMASCDSAVTNFSRQLYRVTKPYGVTTKSETIIALRNKFKKMDMEEAKKAWQTLYESTENKCVHRALFNRCRRGEICESGTRKLQLWILTGAVLSMWDSFEKRYPQHFNKSKLRIVRLKISEKVNVIGIDVEKKMVTDLKAFLENPNPLAEVKKSIPAPQTMATSIIDHPAETVPVKLDVSEKLQPQVAQPVKSMPIFKL